MAACEGPRLRMAKKYLQVQLLRRNFDSARPFGTPSALWFRVGPASRPVRRKGGGGWNGPAAPGVGSDALRPAREEECHGQQRPFRFRGRAVPAGGGDAQPRAGPGLCLWAGAQARPARGDRHPPRQFLRGRGNAAGRSAGRRQGGRAGLRRQGGGLCPRPRGDEGHAGAAHGLAHPRRSGPRGPRVRTRDRQWPHAAHVRADHAVRSGRAQVARDAAEAAGPAMAGARVAADADASGDRERPVARRHRPDGPPQAGRPGAEGVLRLADRQALRGRCAPR
jgi:hypothetical protein